MHWRNLSATKGSKAHIYNNILLNLKRDSIRQNFFGTVWSDDLLAYRLLKNTNLSENHEQLAKATITNLTFNDMKQKLRNIFGESSNILTGPSSIT